MAKRSKARAARTPQRKTVQRRGAQESLLLRSAETLGRVIGKLQRQLDQKLATAAHSTSGTRTRTRARKRVAARRRPGK